MNKNYEDIKSIIVSTVSLLCKNGLSHHQLKIEGLLALTVNNKDIVLINFAENFTRETVDSTPSSSIIQKSVLNQQDSELSTIETSSNSTFNDRVTSDFIKNVNNINENEKEEVFLIELNKDVSRYNVKPERIDDIVSNDHQYPNQFHNINCIQNSSNKTEYPQNNRDIRTTRGRKPYKHHYNENTTDCSTSTTANHLIEVTSPAPNHSSQQNTNLFFETTCQKDLDTLFRKQYICEFPGCSKPYSTRRSMLRHQTVAHGRIPCFKKSKSYNQVMNELQSHTN